MAAYAAPFHPIGLIRLKKAMKTFICLQPNPRGKEHFLKWVYARLPANFLGQLYDRMVDRLLVEKAPK